MLAAGVPTAIVSRMLQRSSIGITVDTHGHLSEETARTASDAIGALLDAAFEQAAATFGDHTCLGAATAAPETARDGTYVQVKHGRPRGERPAAALIDGGRPGDQPPRTGEPASAPLGSRR